MVGSSTARAQALACFLTVTEALHRRLVEGVVAMAQRLHTLVQQWRTGREFNRRLTLYWGRRKNGPPLPLRIAREGKPLAHPEEKCQGNAKSE